MTQDSIYWNNEFRNALSKYCDDLFIDAHLFHYNNRIFPTKDNLCRIDITDYIKADYDIKTIDKVKFCVAWLNTLPIINGELSYYGVVHINGKDFDFMHHTDFTSYIQSIGYITQKEQNEINQEWLDITDGEPYYTLS